MALTRQFLLSRPSVSLLFVRRRLKNWSEEGSEFPVFFFIGLTFTGHSVVFTAAFWLEAINVSEVFFSRFMLKMQNQ